MAPKHLDTGQHRYLRSEGVVDPEWLEGHLSDPNVRVIEVDVSGANHGEWHIDGAVLWDVYRDLKDTEYRLIDTSTIQDLLDRSGIRPESIVVFYGYAPAMGFWLMKLIGHQEARILDCSRHCWRTQGRPWSDTVSTPEPTHYPLGDVDIGVRADLATVHNAISDPAVQILDVRSDAEYRGERFWPSGGAEPGGRPGHVPSAIHQPIDGIYNADGSFRDDLSNVFSLIDLADGNSFITYCTIGGRASTAWFVLTYLMGVPDVLVYDGSWAEWGRSPTTPVVCGPGGGAVLTNATDKAPRADTRR